MCVCVCVLLHVIVSLCYTAKFFKVRIMISFEKRDLKVPGSVEAVISSCFFVFFNLSNNCMNMGEMGLQHISLTFALLCMSYFNNSKVEN